MADIVITAIAASEQVITTLVVASVTAFRRATHNIKVCPLLNKRMVPIASTFIYPCNCVLRSQVITFDVANVIAECY